MKNKEKRILLGVVISAIVFIIYTITVKFVMVTPVGPKGSKVGFGKINKAIHQAIGVNMIWYEITDLFVIIAIVLAVGVAVFGIIQGIVRKSAKKIDNDIVWTVIYYFLVIGMYLVFEQIPINYRPIILEGELEYSYPSSHSMVILCIAVPLIYHVSSRIKNSLIKNSINICIIVVMILTIIGRILSGVHWITDIIGAILISLFLNVLFLSVIVCKYKKL